MGEVLNVVTSAAKHEQDIAESPSAITVITREQIENTHCTDVACLLRQIPEVVVMRIVPMWTSVGARALTNDWGDKALVLIDGQEVNVEVFGIAMWQALSVYLDDIERIEIIRGPGSALYGANAHSLVVSIITRPASGDGAEAVTWGAEHDHAGFHLRASKVFGDWRLQLSGGHEFSGHWQHQDTREAEVTRLRLRADHQSDWGDSTLQLGLLASDGTVFALLFPGSANDTLLANLSASHRTDYLRARISLGLGRADVFLDIPLFFGDLILGKVKEPYQFFTSTLDGQLEFSWSPFSDNLLIAGLNYRWITFLSQQNDPEENHQQRFGVFLHGEQRLWETLVLTAGVRFDYNTITPIAVSPRVAVVWQFLNDQYLRLSFGMAFRKPSFLNTSLHMTNIESSPEVAGMAKFSRDSLGNSDLGNESITSFEAGYIGRFLNDELMAEADIFYNRYRDTVNLHTQVVTSLGIPDLNRSILEFRNLGMEADSIGGSVSLSYRLRKTLWVSFNYSTRYSWYIADPQDLSAGPTTKKGDRVAWEPTHQGNLSFHYLQDHGLRIGAALHGVSSLEMYLKKDGDLFQQMIPVSNPAHWFASGFVAWRVVFYPGWIEIGVRAYNILETRFKDRSSVTRLDGTEDGGELIGRRISFFLRGAI
jgi:iron complex outermembrane receptor protein